MEVKYAIRLARREKQMNQVELAKILGVTVQAVSAWECGVAHPSLDIYLKLREIIAIEKFLKEEMEVCELCKK